MVTKPGGAYIDNLPARATGKGYYELQSTRDEYLAFHYPDGDPLDPLLGSRTPPLAQRFPFAVRGFWRAVPDGAALDVGAACGRVTFDLARDHRVAFGVDLSPTLIGAAREVQATGRASYRTVLEGELLREHDVRVETAANARFLVADALALPFGDRAFATVAALNLVDRVPDPARALDELERVTAPGGLLLVASPYTWLDTHAPRERWLGGRRGAQGAERGCDAVRARFASGFRLVQEARLPFFIAHHARSGQLAITHIQIFERKS